MPATRARGPFLAALGAAAVGTLTVGIVRFSDRAPDRPRTPPPAMSSSPSSPIPPSPSPAPVLEGTPDHYVLPGAGDAVLWRGDPAHGALTPGGALAAFVAVHVLSGTPTDNMVPIALAGGTGYVDAARLMPGDAGAAHRAACAYQAGRPPANAEVLGGGGDGGGRATLANASSGPAVITLRGSDGRLIVRVYLASRGAARLDGLAGGPWTAEIAFGELWSRACGGFVAGERVLRAGAALPPGGTLTIGPQAPNG